MAFSRVKICETGYALRLVIANQTRKSQDSAGAKSRISAWRQKMKIYDWHIAPNPRRLHIYLAYAVSARPSAKV